MTCGSVRRQSTPYVDGMLRGDERSRIAAHVRECGSCASYLDDLGSIRSELRGLPPPVPPARLTTTLRIVASQERQVIEQRQGSRLRRMWNRWMFRLDDIMRPLTIPATGGLLSSLILFGTLAFTIGASTRNVNYEVPVLYAERTDPNLVPLRIGSGEVVLTISLDSNGRIRDYAVLDGSDSFTGDAARLQSTNIALPQFPSVLAVAHPVSGDIRISFTPLELRQ